MGPVGTREVSCKLGGPREGPLNTVGPTDCRVSSEERGARVTCSFTIDIKKFYKGER